MGLVGPGFVATHHIDAVRRLGDVDVVAICGSSQEAAERKALELCARKAYGSYLDLIEDPAVEVVHNTTPNHLHLDVSLAALRAGKHVISDKPLALNHAECCILRDAAEAAGVVNVVTFNYRGNSLVQHARLMTAAGDLGAPFFIHGKYFQDWMADDQVYTWRSDPLKGGPSSALADIGSHWCDLAQHISASKIIAVMAEMTTVVKTRFTSKTANGALGGGKGHPVAVSGEDLATVLLRFDNGAKGCLSVGQVVPGYKNNLEIEVNGRIGSVRWNQECQNDLWIGRHNALNSVMANDSSFLRGESRGYTRLPPGHQDGWSDSFRNVIGDAYQWIRTQADPAKRPATICTFAEAAQVCCVVEAMVRSQAAGGVWETVDRPESARPASDAIASAADPGHNRSGAEGEPVSAAGGAR
jgi:predicted dehydrogenase